MDGGALLQEVELGSNNPLPDGFAVSDGHLYAQGGATVQILDHTPENLPLRLSGDDANTCEVVKISATLWTTRCRSRTKGPSASASSGCS